MTIGKKILIINKFYQGDITLPKKDSALENPLLVKGIWLLSLSDHQKYLSAIDLTARNIYNCNSRQT